MSKKKYKKLKQKISLLEEQCSSMQQMLQMTTENMREVQSQLQNSKNDLLLRNKYIQDSINYAFRIQTSLLESEERLSEQFGNSFLLYKPKDVVCGDFYWTHVTEKARYLAVVDCTGHGIPGAMLTVLGISTLNNIIAEEPEISLKELTSKLHIKVKCRLNVNNPDHAIHDGMDMGIIKIDRDYTSLTYTGVKIPLYIYREGKLLKYKGNRFSIGDDHFDSQKIMEINIALQKGDQIYLFSDGFADQFSDSNKKYTIGRFKDTLTQVSNLSMVDKKIALEQELITWKGNASQTDDVLVVGLNI